MNVYKSVVLALVMVTAGWLYAGAEMTPHGDFANESIETCHMCHESVGIPANHTVLWNRDHRAAAEKKPNNCQDCHQQSFCTDCHFGGNMNDDLKKSQAGASVMPESHRTDWLEMHPLKAMEDRASCYKCHDSRKYCADCHDKFTAADLSVYSHRKGWSDLAAQNAGTKHSTFSTNQCSQCHPNSVLPSHQWSSAHANEARKNLKACQSCHPEGQVCLKCHSASVGLKANPHPAGWGDIKGRLESAGNRRSCNKCH